MGYYITSTDSVIEIADTPKTTETYSTPSGILGGVWKASDGETDAAFPIPNVTDASLSSLTISTVENVAGRVSSKDFAKFSGGYGYFLPHILSQDGKYDYEFRLTFKTVQLGRVIDKFYIDRWNKESGTRTNELYSANCIALATSLANYNVDENSLNLAITLTKNVIGRITGVTLWLVDAELYEVSGAIIDSPLLYYCRSEELVNDAMSAYSVSPIGKRCVRLATISGISGISFARTTSKITNFYVADFSTEPPSDREPNFEGNKGDSLYIPLCAVFEDGTYHAWDSKLITNFYTGEGDVFFSNTSAIISLTAKSPRAEVIVYPDYDKRDDSAFAIVNIKINDSDGATDPYSPGGYGNQTNPTGPGTPQIPGGSGGVPSGPSGGVWGGGLGGTSTPGNASVQSTDTGLFRAYSMTLTEIQRLGRELWSASILDTISKYFENPADLIMGILEYPFAIQGGVSEQIVFNWLPSDISTFDVTGSRLSGEYVTLNFGTVEIPRVSGTYYDFQPFTTAEVYLPYIGFVPIKYSEVVGGTLSLIYNVSLTSGAGVAILSSSKLGVTGTFNCIIGRQLPVTTRDFSSTYVSIAKAGLAAAAGLVGAGMAGAANIASAAFVLDPTNFYRPNALSTINTLGTMANVGGQMASHGSRSFGQSAINSVSNANGHITRSGSFDSASGRCSNQNAFVIVSAPHQNLPAAYGKTLGYPCNIGGLLGQFSGYTEVRSINVVAIGASSAELSEIENILKGGIII